MCAVIQQIRLTDDCHELLVLPDSITFITATATIPLQ